MKRFNEEEFTGKPDQTVDDVSTAQAEADSSGKDTYRRFENKYDKNNSLTPSMKRFRRIVGAIILVFFIYSFFFANSPSTRNYISGIESGRVDGVKAGEILSQETVRLEPKDYEVNIANGYGRLELSIWNFNEKEDGD